MPSPQDARPVVLLVDDESLVRMFNADILNEAGFRVVEAVNAEEAWLLFQARPDVQLVLTDVETPSSMKGLELAKRVAELRPFVGVIIISGRARPSPATFRATAGSSPSPIRGPTFCVRSRRPCGFIRQSGPEHSIVRASILSGRVAGT